MSPDRKRNLIVRNLHRAAIVGDATIRVVGSQIKRAVVTGENSMSDPPYDTLHDRAKISNMDALYREGAREAKANGLAFKVGWREGSYSVYLRAREKALRSG